MAKCLEGGCRGAADAAWKHVLSLNFVRPLDQRSLVFVLGSKDLKGRTRVSVYRLGRCIKMRSIQYSMKFLSSSLLSLSLSFCSCRHVCIYLCIACIAPKSQHVCIIAMKRAVMFRIFEVCKCHRPTGQSFCRYINPSMPVLYLMKRLRPRRKLRASS